MGRRHAQKFGQLAAAAIVAGRLFAGADQDFDVLVAVVAMVFVKWHVEFSLDAVLDFVLGDEIIIDHDARSPQSGMRRMVGS